MLYKNEKWLKEKLKNNSVAEISEMLGCGEMTIYRWMKRFGIKKEELGSGLPSALR